MHAIDSELSTSSRPALFVKSLCVFSLVAIRELGERARLECENSLSLRGKCLVDMCCLDEPLVKQCESVSFVSRAFFSVGAAVVLTGLVFLSGSLLHGYLSSRAGAPLEDTSSLRLRRNGFKKA